MPLEHAIYFSIRKDNVLDKVKAHIREHKIVYSFGAGVVFAGITCIIMKGRSAGLPESTASRSETVFTRPFFFFSNNNQVITIFQRVGRGRPGNMTQCLETGRKWASQSLAAESQGVSDKTMSMHVRGKGLPDINGFHFEQVRDQF